MLSKYEKMNTNVQWIRIVASIIVIGCHIRLLPVTDGVIDKSVLLISGLFDDGVSVFFIIMGFFLMQREIIHTWKRTITYIFIPALVVRILSEVAEPFLYHQQDILSCLLQPNFNWENLFSNLLSISLTGSNLSFHLWYVRDYLIIVLMLPLLQPMCTNSKTYHKAILWVAGVSFAGLLLNDVQKLYSLPTGTINLFSFLSIPASMCISGHLLWQYRSKIENNRLISLIAAFVFAAINVLRYFFQLKIYSVDINDIHFFYWNTSLGWGAALSLICFFLSLKIKKNALVNYIGSKTYVIYLLHVMVYTYLDGRGIRGQMLELMVKYGIVGELAYDVLYSCLIFLVCLIIISAFDCIGSLANKYIKRKFAHCQD